MNEGKPKREGVTRREFGGLVAGAAALLFGSTKSRAEKTLEDLGWVKRETLDFKIFPKELSFKPGKLFLAVHREQQIAKLYNADGTEYVKDGKPVEILCGTGKPETPTKKALYQIQRQAGEDYRSKKYPENRKKEEPGAPMPWAQHLGEVVIGNDSHLETLESDGTAIHGRKTVGLTMLQPRKSHGCLGVQKGIAKFLKETMKIGDYVAVFDDPEVLKKSKSIKEIVKNKRE